MSKKGLAEINAQVRTELGLPTAHEVTAEERARLTILYASEDSGITDDDLQDLTKLRTLSAWGNRDITDAGVQGLINLRVLNADEGSGITDKGVLKLVNLREIYAVGNSRITEAVQQLVWERAW